MYIYITDFWKTIIRAVPEGSSIAQDCKNEPRATLYDLEAFFFF